MRDARTVERIRRKYESPRPEMDERMRRQWAAAEARGLGWGGVTAVAAATGLSRVTVAAGLAESDQEPGVRRVEAERVRRPGGGRPPLTESDPGLADALEALVEPTAREDPMSPVRPAVVRTSQREGFQLAAFGSGKNTVVRSQPVDLRKAWNLVTAPAEDGSPRSFLVFSRDSKAAGKDRGHREKYEQ